MPLYKIYNGAAPTTAGFVKVATGTSIKTMLQVKPGTQNKLKVVEWGASFDGTAANTPVLLELIEVDVAATVTAHVAAGIVKLGDPNDVDPTTSNISVGTSATGYTSSNEGTPTASRLLDCQLVAPTNQWAIQFPLGREPVVDVSKFLRIRVTAGTTVNMVCYVVVEV